MAKIIKRWWWLFFVAAMAHAQSGAPVTFQYVVVAPSGACVGTPPVAVVYFTGAAWVCASGQWVPLGGQGGGSGNISGSLASGALVLGTGTNTVGPSLATDNGLVFGYPGTGGILSPEYTFGNVSSGLYGLLQIGDNNGNYPSLQLFGGNGSGTTVDSTGVFAPSLQTGGGILGGALLISGVSQLGALQNTVPGQPIQIGQAGGGPVALQINGGLTVTGTCTGCGGGGASGTVSSGSAFAPTYYTANGTTVGGATPFNGIQWDSTTGAPAAATATQVNSVISTLTNCGTTGSVLSPAAAGCVSVIGGLTPGQQVGSPTASTLANLKVFDVDLFPTSCTVSAVAYTTQLDCAFYTAKAYVIANNASVALKIHAATYNTLASLIMPTGSANSVYLLGDGQNLSYITYTGTSAIPVIFRNDTSTRAFMKITDLTINGGYHASSILDLRGLNQSEFGNLTLSNVVTGTAYMVNFASGFQLNGHDIQVLVDSGSPSGNFGAPSVYGSITCTPDGSQNIANAQCSITQAGSAYPTNAPTMTLVFNAFQNGTSNQPCTTMPVGTGTINTSTHVLTSFNITTNGAGCVGTAYGTAAPIFQTTYGFQFQVSDSQFYNLTAYIGSKAGFWTPTNSDKFYNLHPAFTLNGIYNQSGSYFAGTEFDNTLRHGFWLGPAAGSPCTTGRSCNLTISGTTSFSNGHGIMAPDVFFLDASGTPANISGNLSLCGNNGVCPTGWAEYVTTTGIVGNGAYPSSSSMYGNDYLASSLGDFTPKLYAGSLTTAVFTIATLPTLPNALYPNGSHVVVSDATTFTVGTCTGGGSDTMIAVSSGSAWTCH